MNEEMNFRPVLPEFSGDPLVDLANIFDQSAHVLLRAADMLRAERTAGIRVHQSPTLKRYRNVEGVLLAAIELASVTAVGKSPLWMKQAKRP